jgi:hypothetical protein
VKQVLLHAERYDDLIAFQDAIPENKNQTNGSMQAVS